MTKTADKINYIMLNYDFANLFILHKPVFEFNQPKVKFLITRINKFIHVLIYLNDSTLRCIATELFNV